MSVLPRLEAVDRHEHSPEVQQFIADVRKAIHDQARHRPFLKIVVSDQGKSIPIRQCFQHFRMLQYAAGVIPTDRLAVADPMMEKARAIDVDTEDVRDGKLQTYRQMLVQPGYIFPKPTKVPIPKANGGFLCDDGYIQSHWRTHPTVEGSDQRILLVPSLEARLQGRVLAFLISEYLERKGHYDRQVVGFRPSKSITDTLSSLADHITEKRHAWIIAADITKFYDTIPIKPCLQQVISAIGMKSDLGQQSGDEQYLVDLIKRHMSLPDDGRGIPQGQPLSPLLANIYGSNTIDKEIRKLLKPNGIGWLRYADDVAITCPSKNVAVTVAQTLQRKLVSYGLKLHEHKSFVHNILTGRAYDLAGTQKDDQRLVYLGCEVKVQQNETWSVAYSISTKAIGKLYDGLRSIWNTEPGDTQLMEKESIHALQIRIPRSVQTIQGWLSYYGHAWHRTPTERQDAIRQIIGLSGCSVYGMIPMITHAAQSELWQEGIDRDMKREMVIFRLEQRLGGDRNVLELSKWKYPSSDFKKIEVTDDLRQELDQRHGPGSCDRLEESGYLGIAIRLQPIWRAIEGSIRRFEHPQRIINIA